MAATCNKACQLASTHVVAIFGQPANKPSGRKVRRLSPSFLKKDRESIERKMMNVGDVRSNIAMAQHGRVQESKLKHVLQLARPKCLGEVTGQLPSMNGKSTV